MSKKNFKWGTGSLPAIRLHSAAKLRLITDYLGRYFDTVTKQPQIDKIRITLVDGFCGGGEFSDGDSVVSGTPILLLDAVAEAQARISMGRNKPVVLDAVFHFVDADKGAIDHLIELLRTRGMAHRIGDDIHIYNETFESAYPKIKTAIRSHTRPSKGRSLFILDQLGYTAVPTVILRDILSSFSKSEIILTLAVDWLIDFLRKDPAAALPIDALEIEQAKVAEMASLRDKKAGRKLIQTLLLENLKTSTGASYQSPFFIHSAEAGKDLWLVHLSHHFTARNVMVESHWSEKNTSWHPGKGGFDIMGYDPNLDPYAIPDFFFGESEIVAGREYLAEDFMRQLSDHHGGKTVKLREFLSSVANLTPARLSDMDEVIKLLALNNDLIIEDTDGKTRRTTSPKLDDKIKRNPQFRMSLPVKPKK